MSDSHEMSDSQTSDAGSASQNFQVDLAGLVDLLSRNLYSGPQVFVRELLQNGTDAISARREIDPDCPACIRFEADGSTLRVIDSGIGLTQQEARAFLATIGATSKRDEFGLARTDYLGQFGIGLLSCFMVSSTITVLSRSARRADAPTVRWLGRSDGTWSVDLAEEPLPEPGTAVVLEDLPGESPFAPARLRHLIADYGQYLPVQVELSVQGGPGEPLAGQRAPWELSQAASTRWCIENFGFHPFAEIELSVPEAGFEGVGYVLPSGAHPGQLLRHRVYLRRMLLSPRATDLLPEWAYFVRVVGDSRHLRPTASRESLFDDDLLETVRESLGAQVRAWLTHLSLSDPKRFLEFITLHLEGLKALAVSDAPTRSMVAASVPFITSMGVLTLDEVLERHGAIHYVLSNSHFKAFSPVAAANGLCIVSAGYAFDDELLSQLTLDRPDADISVLDPSILLDALTPPDPDEEASLARLLILANEALSGTGVVAEIRSFDPGTIPVLFLPDADFAGQTVAESARSRSTGTWADVLSAADPFANSSAPRLVLNARAQLINELAGGSRDQLAETAVRGLYVQALMAGQHPMDAKARAWSSQIFTHLIELSLKGPQ